MTGHDVMNKNNSPHKHELRRSETLVDVLIRSVHTCVFMYACTSFRLEGFYVQSKCEPPGYPAGGTLAAAAVIIYTVLMKNSGE